MTGGGGRFSGYRAAFIFCSLIRHESVIDDVINIHQ
jgi:hypothetical protein